MNEQVSKLSRNSRSSREAGWGRQKLGSDGSKQISSRAIRKKWVVSAIMSEGLDMKRENEDSFWKAGIC